MLFSIVYRASAVLMTERPISGFVDVEGTGSAAGELLLGSRTSKLCNAPGSTHLPVCR
jgi:hypothetical protein